MKKPPDFVMYVVMYTVDGKKFEPYWEQNMTGVHAMGYLHKGDAHRRLKHIRKTWGKDAAYVQQYGPYS